MVSSQSRKTANIDRKASLSIVEIDHDVRRGRQAGIGKIDAVVVGGSLQSIKSAHRIPDVRHILRSQRPLRFVEKASLLHDRLGIRKPQQCGDGTVAVGRECIGTGKVGKVAAVSGRVDNARRGQRKRVIVGDLKVVQIHVVASNVVSGSYHSVCTCVEVESVVGSVGGFRIIPVGTGQSAFAGYVDMSQAERMPHFV